MTGIYIHVPFCKRKCPYCDFYSVCRPELYEDYTQAVCRNIEAFKGRDIKCDTIYFGGGTPSVLSAEQVDRIIDTAGKCFDLCQPEITLEANPSSVDREKMSGWRKAGVTRLSFGVQSANDRELGFLGRLHDFSQAKSAVETAAQVGFRHISCDIMLGVKGQTLESLWDSIESLTALPVDHISAYMLKIEKGTAFDCDEMRNAVADDDMLCDMYLQTVGQLASKSFLQYEISNFAKEGGKSRHNLKYWHGEEYIGIGPSAHSFFDNERYYCKSDVEEFISDKMQSMVVLEDDPDKAEEYVMLGLRLTEGIDIGKAEELGGKELGENIRKKAALFQKQGLCVVEKGILRLTPAGFLASNSIIGELLW